MIASWPASREKDHMLEPLQQRPPPKGPSPAGPPPPTPTLFSKASIKPQVHSTLRNEPLQQTPPPAGPPPATPGPGYKFKPIPDTDYPAWEYYRTGGRIIHPHETRLWPPSPPRPKKRGWWSITSLWYSLWLDSARIIGANVHTAEKPSFVTVTLREAQGLDTAFG